MGFLDRLFGRKKAAPHQTKPTPEPPDIPSNTGEPVAEQTAAASVEEVSATADAAPEQAVAEAGGERTLPAEIPRHWDDVTQRKLDRYFTRLREIYPDGVIIQLNTGHKKLAERGAQLRRQLEMEGELDAFFALGGFRYCRKGGGRPPLPLTEADCQAMHSRLRQLFPQGVPLVMAVREADHRLYLDLRAVARREGKNVGEYLRENGLLAEKRTPSGPADDMGGE